MILRLSVEFVPGVPSVSCWIMVIVKMKPLGEPLVLQWEGKFSIVIKRSCPPSAVVPLPFVVGVNPSPARRDQHVVHALDEVSEETAGP